MSFLKRIVVFIILLISCFSAQAIKVSNRKPKLVVGIVVDQMRYDYIYKYWDNFSEGGFKRLMNNGFFCSNTSVNYVPSYTAPGHASIYTGTTPATHGIISNSWFNKSNQKFQYCTGDTVYKTIGSGSEAGKMSPQNLLSSTIGDELRLASNMQSRVIGIALKDRASILPAGHLANAAYWFDASTGNWISSSFYMKDLPEWAKQFNAKQNQLKYLSQKWDLLLPKENYKHSLADSNQYERCYVGELKPVFPHDIPNLMQQNGGAEIIRATPFGNSLTKDFAVKMLLSEQLGKTGNTDFLALSFSSTDVVAHQFGCNSMEVEDTYLRLDRDLSDFFQFLDSYIGMDNVLLFLTADHAGIENPAYLKDSKMPAGYFKANTSIDSLKKYLRNKYSDTLVLSYSNEQIFLNTKKINELRLNHQQIENDIADFMMRIEGVGIAVAANTLKNIEFNSGIRSYIQNGYHLKRSGDVCIHFEPSWIDYRRTGSTHGSAFSYDTHIPLIFYGWGIKKGSTSETIHITDIAPTIAQLLHIQFPSGCNGQPIVKILK